MRQVRVGDRVPADARLVELMTTTLSTDESSLTGESTTALKSLEAVPADAPVQERSHLGYISAISRLYLGEITR